MAPVQIKASSRTGNWASTTSTWAAQALFAHRTQISNITSASSANIGSSATQLEHAQSITPASAFTLAEVRVVLNKNASPTDNLIMELLADNGSNLPSTTVIDTATNVISGTNLTTTQTWTAFHFLNYPSLSSGVKYWFRLRRSGAQDGTNFFTIRLSTGNAYTGGGWSAYNSTSSTWGTESSTNDWTMQVLSKEPIALYAITSDTALHMFKSTDLGASWSEQDSAHAPSTSSTTSQFAATQPRTGPFITAARMTATNTANVRNYNISTDLWDTADFGTTPPSAVSSTRTMRVSVENLFASGLVGTVNLHYTDSVDDADLAYQRVTAAANAWSAQTLFLSVTSASASNINDVVTDKFPAAFKQQLYSDVANADFSIRSLQATTLGTETDLDATAMGTTASFISANYQIYQSSSAVDTIVCAYVDANGDLIERILTLEATSASVGMASPTTVDTGGLYAGRSVATARYNGTNYIMWAASSTLVYVTSSSPGSWSGSTTWKSGLTSNPIISNMLAIEGTGLAAIYTDNSTNVQFDWIVAPSTTSTRTATPVTIALQSTSTRSATATIALQGTLTRTASATIALQKLNTTRTATPVTVALSLQKTRTATATIALSATLTRTATATIALSQVRTRTATPVTVALSLTSTRTASATIALQATSTRTSAATIALSQVRSRTATPVTVALSLETTRSASATIALIGTLTRTATATIALSSTAGGGTRTATPVTIALSASNITRTATPVTIALSTPDKTRTATPVTVALQATSTRTATATIALSQARTRTSTATIALSQQRTRTATATIALSATLTRSAPATIALSQVRTRTSTPVTIALSLAKTRTASATIALSATKTRTATPVTLALSLVRTRIATTTVALSLTTTRTATATIALSILAPIVVAVPSAVMVLAAPVPLFGTPGATAAWDPRQGAGLYNSSQSDPTGTKTQAAGIEGLYDSSQSGPTGTKTQPAGVTGTARKTDRPPTGEVS